MAINAILAQTIHTCLADYSIGGLYAASFLPCHLRMTWPAGDSYYIVEIKVIEENSESSGRTRNHQILCFVDEVLRGTNTVERIAASTQILKSLSKDNVILFCGNSRYQLTYLLEEKYNNFHFEEEIRG
ncbi:hypothetical protein [Kineothrix sp. MB12-C1]|uniref:hypothetical protein n=1 Tax=Kineothrix sp. MB12-C1 TaxID=3070215 RepID=UPI0027D2F5CE|nr:hypothetical protein [Kineothrix sp. MB12-C1]WMC92729.1 hypothetical protein RBB56_00100 [Kineothrix sp. MB12-C1]